MATKKKTLKKNSGAKNSGTKNCKGTDSDG